MDAQSQELLSLFQGSPAARSLELRWIRPGPPPAELISSFLSGCMEIEARVDRYLIAPLGSGIGLKRRGDSQIDLKIYGGDAGELGVPQLGAGRVGSWQKWSSPLDAAAHAPAADVADWLSVRKLRRRRTFILVAEHVAEREFTGPPTDGCSAELTEVHLDNHVWWTFSLEAPGSGGRQLHELRQTARHLHGTLRGPLEFARADATSYVRWLSSLADLQQFEARAAGHQR